MKNKLIIVSLIVIALCAAVPAQKDGIRHFINNVLLGESAYEIIGANEKTIGSELILAAEAGFTDGRIVVAPVAVSNDGTRLKIDCYFQRDDPLKLNEENALLHKQRRITMTYEEIVRQLEGYEFDKLVQHGDGIGFVFRAVSPNIGNPKTVVVPNLEEVYIEE